ncbi:MAG TPA: GNAT family N-acetyltransferase [Pseudomonadales bacterium]|nr:GNAT family N-acetyltransferase [Pseudomonadales bacterium]
MIWTPRLAREEDIPALEELIPLSVRTLQTPYYSPAQMEMAIGPVFNVDRQLIRDGTYFVVEDAAKIVGCGGWSKRKKLSGCDGEQIGLDELLNPSQDAARIRAFFIHPEWARRGIGASIVKASEGAAIKAGFQKMELVATLAGEPLYASHGYTVVRRYDSPMSDGISLPVVHMAKSFEKVP